MTELLGSRTVGEIVATDFRAAAVFEQFGIDFCCGGGRLLADACRTASVDQHTVAGALDGLGPQTGTEDDAAEWPLDRLIDHIIDTHHGYVRAVLPVISRYVAKLHKVHGTRHPELSRVAAHWEWMRRDLEQHMMKEEQVLFPYVRTLAAKRAAAGGADSRSPFGTIENPIRMFEREHREVGDEMATIRELTGGYAAPADGCTTSGVCMAELSRFERDLHRHVHLENNVLFPKAVELESTVCRG